MIVKIVVFIRFLELDSIFFYLYILDLKYIYSTNLSLSGTGICRAYPFLCFKICYIIYTDTPISYIISLCSYFWIIVHSETAIICAAFSIYSVYSRIPRRENQIWQNVDRIYPCASAFYHSYWRRHLDFPYALDIILMLHMYVHQETNEIHKMTLYL